MEERIQDVLDEHRTHLGFSFPPKDLLREGDTLECSCKGFFLLLKPEDVVEDNLPHEDMVLLSLV